MKYLKTSAIMAMLCACSLHTLAQNQIPLNKPDLNKPKLFSDLPDKMSLRLGNVESLLNFSVGASVNTTIATDFPLIGRVVSKSNPADSFVKSVVISSKTRPGAIFTFSRIANKDGTVKFIGRMISKGASDALLFVKEGNTYIIQKKGYYDVVNE